MGDHEEACSECNGQVEYDESAHTYVCVECGSTSTQSVRLVSQELAKDVGSHRRILEVTKTDNHAFERRVQKFASAAISISRKLGDSSVTLALDMVNFARKILAAMPTKPVPQGRKVEMFGVAAAYVRAKRKGMPVTLNDVASIAHVEPKALYAGYKAICRHTNTNVPQPAGSTESYFTRFRPIVKKLLPNSWKFLSQTYSSVRRIIDLFYNKSGRSRLFITAVTIMFAIRSIACAQLEPIIPTVALCAYEISRCGISDVNTISRRSLEVEYRYLEKEMKKSLVAGEDFDGENEVHASLPRLHDSLFEKCADGDGSDRDWKVREERQEIVARIRGAERRGRKKRKKGDASATPGTKRQRTKTEDDGDDSDVEDALLTEVEVEKRARSLGIDYMSPVTD